MKICIHKKVWGEEHWVVNKNYCGKILILQKGYRCSIHYHELKDETFYVLTGRVLLEVNGHPKILMSGDKQHIGLGDMHRFTGLENSRMVEFSTHDSPTDNYRTVLSEKVPEKEFQELSNIQAIYTQD